MTDLQLFDLSTIPTEPYRANLARLADTQLTELDDLTYEVTYYAHQRLVDVAVTAGIAVDPLPDDLVDAIFAHFGPLLAAIEAERTLRDYLNFRCLDCQVNTLAIGQYPYNCPDELWDAVVPGGEGMLCLACLARRLDTAGLPWPSSLRPQSVTSDHDAH